jgi:hypothetical protein
LNKERIQGPENKFKDLKYDPFEVLEKVDDNAYKLSISPYTYIYSIVNVENMNPYEPSTLDQRTKEQVLSTIVDLALES